MIPFIRSFTELMIITQSRDKVSNSSKNINKNKKIYSSSIDKNSISLPDLPRRTRPKWKKGKEAISNFIDSLDYNNQIQSSYDLTLLDRQSKNSYEDVA